MFFLFYTLVLREYSNKEEEKNLISYENRLGFFFFFFKVLSKMIGNTWTRTIISSAEEQMKYIFLMKLRHEILPASLSSLIYDFFSQ